ncbi:MAG: hypothetical protein ABR887_09235 [Methanoregulaceae archaeon]|jgi:hypothetical protein
MLQVRFPIPSITDLKPGDHACCIYDTDEEHRNIITPFLRKGFEQNEKIFFELSESSIICENINVAGNGTGNNKQDRIISAVKNL